ncbi:hypothetical protein HBI04_080280 [Parastagonospora nodorum]|nr:hypothetical protein HBI04_080280 [Parastagonospora nodorum]KAH5339998.1 hypothetical protein HBI12_001800 [Parastagonospora nodorum]KAH5384320.1 hypothetical protein HBI33_100780 [Parastagonospora nodorum]KAH5603482.1 hypothetical protein HBI45_116940 [Parastagonospora nodorum]KAH5812514.1 hypothetical protein HBI96_077070 [Parastagonospora nodorum]
MEPEVSRSCSFGPLTAPFQRSWLFGTDSRLESNDERLPEIASRIPGRISTSRPGSTTRRAPTLPLLSPHRVAFPTLGV